MNDSTQDTAAHTTADAGKGSAVALSGYPPKRNPKGVRRLYRAPDSPTHVEIKVADIVDQPPGEVKRPRESGERVLWVRRSARITLREVPVVSDLELPHWPRI